MDKPKLVLKEFVQHNEVALGHHQFRSLYIGFHPISRNMIVHDGHAAKVYSNGEVIYRYEKLGRPPRVAGDTHAALAWSKDLLFIGGWLKAPPGMIEVSQYERILKYQDMRMKYSHIHMIYDDDKVEILWSRKWDDKIPPNNWYGEVTDLLYDEHEDAVYFSRADGHAELGLWKVGVSTRDAEFLVKNRTVYKMEMKDDKIYATIFNPIHTDVSSIMVYNTLNGEYKFVESFDFPLENNKKIQIRRVGGQIVQIQNKLIAFYGGALIHIDPQKDVYRLYPFLDVRNPESERPTYIPGFRAQKAYIMGIPVISANPAEDLRDMSSKTTFGLLLRIDPVVPQIITESGAIFGMAHDGEYLYVGASYANHTGVYTYRAGDGGIFAISVSELFKKPWNPIRIWIHDGSYTPTGGIDGWFGGIPLKGFTEKKIRVYTTKTTKMRIAEYSLFSKVRDDTVTLNTGWNMIDLNNYYDIIAFKLDESIDLLQAEIILE
ncbi:DUF2139 domain-containing protein [Saccharolobus shibatae]|uniref:DUF2139 domain-containing protein n=1 Tax=Saccharolobus shibatae TaxID=2286 RepID=A0A8F5BYZ1_9CREN|nr:DUF2139 domain-containing protein [Saccharolobus shibatae]QXJ33935.1 hypothetical protein J5U22_00480 [Saccharolobus shibatae]